MNAAFLCRSPMGDLDGTREPPEGEAQPSGGIKAAPHGLGWSFWDWAAECSDTSRELCDLALAHVKSDRVEAAYRRTGVLERGLVLM